MKTFLCAFLALLVLMPSLVCAMPACAQSSKLTTVVGAPCHDHAQKEQKSDHVRFVIDCMGVDLQKADVTSFDRIDGLFVTLDFPVIHDTIISQNFSYRPQIIRGPPPEWRLARQDYPSIILMTQRLRI